MTSPSPQLRLTRRGRLVFVGVPLILVIVAFFQIVSSLFGGDDTSGSLTDVLRSTDDPSDAPALRVAATYVVPSGGFLLDEDGPASLGLVSDAPVVVVGEPTDRVAIWLAWQLQSPLVTPAAAEGAAALAVAIDPSWNTRVAIDVGPTGVTLPSDVSRLEVEGDAGVVEASEPEPTGTSEAATPDGGSESEAGDASPDGGTESESESEAAGTVVAAPVRTLADVRAAMATRPTVDLDAVQELLDAALGPRRDRPFRALVRPDESPAALVPLLLAGADIEQTATTDLFTTDAELLTSVDVPVVQAGAVDAWSDVDRDAFAWQQAVVAAGVELPGGGYRAFGGKRYVAMYGSPETTALGVLGEQDVDGSVERSRTLAADYDGLDDLVSVPAWDFIATVASGSPEPTDDYSRRVPQEIVRTWVDKAREEGVYVVLDLQSGRTDFLTQAKELEEFLKEPHVGLALDPEWRLKEDQVHLVQIGSVSVDEVNSVGEWLATLTRENALPEKIFMVHQFTSSMFRERERFDDFPELAEMVQMDGQGSQPGKLSTWEAIIKPNLPEHVVAGWKNFYDEDPETLSPEGTVALDPSPEFVSYQ